MDFEELKNLIQQEGGKIIVVENGKPVMVVLSFEDFKARNPSTRSARSEQASSQIPSEETQNNDEELTIDDLPL